MASKKKNDDVYEVPVTVPRMGFVEKQNYDAAKRQGLTPKQYRKKQDDMLDLAMGFSGPMALSKGVDLRKMSKLKRWGQDLLSRASSGTDNVAGAATNNDDDKKYARGGRIDGIAKRGKTKGRMR